jgi:hypothetical protein
LRSLNDYDCFFLNDSAWDRASSPIGKLGVKVSLHYIYLDSVKPWTLPIISCKLDQVKKYAYLNEFFIQRKNSSALLDLFYDSKEYVSRKDSNLHRKCLDSGSEKNCSKDAINSYFNENGKNKELFTIADWTKSLNSSIMSYGVFLKAQESTIMYRERKFQIIITHIDRFFARC